MLDDGRGCGTLTRCERCGQQHWGRGGSRSARRGGATSLICALPLNAVLRQVVPKELPDDLRGGEVLRGTELLKCPLLVRINQDGQPGRLTFHVFPRFQTAVALYYSTQLPHWRGLLRWQVRNSPCEPRSRRYVTRFDLRLARSACQP